jgi:predicted RNA binding protein with dsRBD fold (UPF0201 family)
VKVTVAAPIRPTEDAAKVRQAVLTLFPDAALAEETGRLAGPVVDLQPLRRRIWELRIIDTARGQVLHGLAPDGASIRFRLGKQAALANQVAFPPRPHVLGDVEVQLVAEAGDTLTPEQWAWWLCPETKDGEIVGPV